MHTQTPYYQFLTSLLYLQPDSPLGLWGCHCSLTHQNKYWLGTFYSHAGEQVLLSAMSAKARLDTTSHHLPPPCSFLFLLSSQKMLFFFHGALEPSSSPTDTLHSHVSWVIFEDDPLATGWSHCEVFRSGSLQWSCSGQSLRFLQRWGVLGFFLLLILANYGTE